MTYFITGSSGAGKSTLVKELESLLLKGFAIHDFDELGVPLDADNSWRIKTAKKWIDIAKENKLKNISTIIVGLTHPDEINEIAKKEQIEVKYCVLEVEYEELKHRLMALRFSSPERIENLKKYAGVTVEEFLENNKKHIEQIKNEALKQDALFIDTTRMSPHAVAQDILNWVKK